VAVGYGSHPDVRAGSTADPPRHTAQKRLVQQAFSARRVRGYESIVREIVRDVVDDVSARAAHGPVDLVEHFAAPIPIRILAAVLGVESSDIPDYVRWSVGLLKPVGRTSVDPDELDEMVQCRKEFDRYFVDILRDRMAEPRDDFMTDFVHGASDGDDPLSIDEMLAIIEQSVIAGHETSTKLIASILLLLSENPQVHERVRDNPDALDAMIDETLRLESPAQMVHRLAVHDVTLGGVEIPAGSAVSLVLGSGNRDPRTMSSPDAIDLERTERRGHFGFGMGAHFCVGRILARLEVSTALSELIDHFDVSMVPGTTREDLHYMPTFAMHGISKLPMQVTPRDRAPENG
jgi:cytochrome P450